MKYRTKRSEEGLLALYELSKITKSAGHETIVEVFPVETGALLNPVRRSRLPDLPPVPGSQAAVAAGGLRHGRRSTSGSPNTVSAQPSLGNETIVQLMRRVITLRR